MPTAREGGTSVAQLTQWSCTRPSTAPLSGTSSWEGEPLSSPAEQETSQVVGAAARHSLVHGVSPGPPQKSGTLSTPQES